jgi:hypothetical protein
VISWDVDPNRQRPRRQISLADQVATIGFKIIVPDYLWSVSFMLREPLITVARPIAMQRMTSFALVGTSNFFKKTHCS